MALHDDLRHRLWCIERGPPHIYMACKTLVILLRVLPNLPHVSAKIELLPSAEVLVKITKNSIKSTPMQVNLSFRENGVTVCDFYYSTFGAKWICFDSTLYDRRQPLTNELLIKHVKMVVK
jgi:hypothetical protein